MVVGSLRPLFGVACVNFLWVRKALAPSGEDFPRAGAYLRSGASVKLRGKGGDAEGIHTRYARMFFDHKLELCGRRPLFRVFMGAGDACDIECSRDHC